MWSLFFFDQHRNLLSRPYSTILSGRLHCAIHAIMGW